MDLGNPQLPLDHRLLLRSATPSKATQRRGFRSKGIECGGCRDRQGSKPGIVILALEIESYTVELGGYAYNMYIYISYYIII
jgi:hypothetical protein